MYVFSKHHLKHYISRFYLFIFCRRGGQLKGVVVRQMLFRPGIREGSVHGSVNFVCPRFFLLLNMNDVNGFKGLW